MTHKEAFWGLISRLLPRSIMQVLAGKSLALIWASTATFWTNWIFAIAPESSQAGFAFHFGSLSGRPRCIDEVQNFSEEAFANLWNLFSFANTGQELYVGLPPAHGFAHGLRFRNSLGLQGSRCFSEVPNKTWVCSACDLKGRLD